MKVQLVRLRFTIAPKEVPRREASTPLHRNCTPVMSIGLRGFKGVYGMSSNVDQPARNHQADALQKPSDGSQLAWTKARSTFRVQR